MIKTKVNSSPLILRSQILGLSVQLLNDPFSSQKKKPIFNTIDSTAHTNRPPSAFSCSPVPQIANSVQNRAQIVAASSSLVLFLSQSYKRDRCCDLDSSIVLLKRLSLPNQFSVGISLIFKLLTVPHRL